MGQVKLDSKKPLISVVVPIYNVEKYLFDALDSLKKQTFSDFEVILVNDASTDNSKHIAGEFLDDKRFRLIDCKQNGGLSVARNTGTLRVKGKWIYYFDSDDRLPLNLFEELSKLMNKDIDIIWFNYAILDEKSPKKIFLKDKPKTFNQKESIQLLLKYKINSAPWSYITRSNVILKNNIKFPVGHNFEDISFNAVLLSKIRNLEVVNFYPGGYFYRLGRKGSISNSLDKNSFDRQIEDQLYLSDFKYNYLKKINTPNIENWYTTALINIFFSYVSFCCDWSEVKDRKKSLLKIKRILKKRHNTLMKISFKNRLRYYVSMHDILVHAYYLIKYNN